MTENSDKAAAAVSDLRNEVLDLIPEGDGLFSLGIRFSKEQAWIVTICLVHDGAFVGIGLSARLAIEDALDQFMAWKRVKEQDNE